MKSLNFGQRAVVVWKGLAGLGQLNAAELDADHLPIRRELLGVRIHESQPLRPPGTSTIGSPCPFTSWRRTLWFIVSSLLGPSRRTSQLTCLIEVVARSRASCLSPL